MNTLKPLLGVVACLISLPCVTRAQAPVIASFSRNGELVCSNLAAGSVATVEWASSLDGPWHTNWAGLDAVTATSGGNITVGVPMFYRVCGTPPSTNPAAPSVTTGSATLVTGTGATLGGSAAPNCAATTGWFRYSTTNPGTGNDTFGTRAPATGSSALGSGFYAVAYSQGITGLSPGTTYYYCAIAQNTLGTTVGSVVSFVTPTPPAAATSSASSIANTSAVLNGSGNPCGAATTGYFRYSMTNPGTPDDTAGTRAPASGGTALGSGWSAQSYARAVGGLTPLTTYYFWAVVTSSEGTAFGTIQSFTTADVPAVTTTAATGVTSYSATLNGTGIPNGNSSFGYFRCSMTDPGSPNDTFGIRIPSSSSGDSYLGWGTSAVAYSLSASGLTPATTYYYCAIVHNSFGTSFGPILSFTTPTAAPVTTTASASLLTGTTAQLNGSSNPGGAATTGWFRYATTNPGIGNDTFGTRVPASGGSALGAGTSAVAFSRGITGLTPGTTYYYCAIADNSRGVSFGAVVSFVAPTLPAAATSSASSIGNTSAQLNGSGTPNGAATTGFFRYSTTNPGTANDTAGTRAPASGGSALGSGWSAQSYSQSVSGLTPLTTYYFWAVVDSSEGTGFGAVQSFKTADVPTVTTTAATAVTSSSATLNGTANPNGNSSSGYFRYSTTNPGTGNDTFGTRAPSSGGSALGSGTSAVAFSLGITGLTPGTTYYYCAIGYNSFGTTCGPILSFTTPATAPVTTTASASLLTGTTAQLNGSVNPGGAAATGWFRYATTNPGIGNDTFGTRVPASGGSALGSGTSAVAFSLGITGLTPGTTYYYCAIADNSRGVSFGAVVSFVAPTLPTAATSSASSIGNTSAQLNGSGNPCGAAAIGYFRYSTTNPGTPNDSAGTRAPASGGISLGSGWSAQSYSQAVSGLSQGTTYYFWAVVSSSEGAVFGAIQSFTTADVPAVTTTAATGVTSTSATLNGTANPNGNFSSGYFRYSTTNPGTGNDTFGTRAPSSGSSALGSGTSAVAFSQGITGLTRGTTYYYCAIAQNAMGVSVGSILSFTAE